MDFYTKVCEELLRIEKSGKIDTRCFTFVALVDAVTFDTEAVQTPLKHEVRVNRRIEDRYMCLSTPLGLVEVIRIPRMAKMFMLTSYLKPEEPK